MRTSGFPRPTKRGRIAALALACAMSGAAQAEEPRISRTMSPDGPVRTITFVLDNMAGRSAVTDYRFTETLDDGLVVASPANVSTTCKGGIVVALPGSATIDYEGGTVPAATACSVRVDVTSDPVEPTASAQATAPAGPIVLGLAGAPGADTQDPQTQGDGAAGDFIEARREEIASRDADLSSWRNNRLADDAKPLRVRARRSGDHRELSIATSLRRLISGAGSIKVSHSFTQEDFVTETTGTADDTGSEPDAPLGFDLWVRGNYVRVRETTRTRENGFAHLGVDYRLSRDLAIGILQQFDVTEDENSGLETTADGWGWLVGPYVVARLPLNLLFDARVALGESYNSVAPSRGDRYHFDARRLLVRGQLSADYAWDALHFRPLVRVLYYDESARGDDGAVPDDAGSIARFEAGYELSYDVRLPDGTTLSPRLAVRGAADYAREDVLSGRLADAGPDEIGARIEAAVRLRSLVGWSLDAGAFYDGIGFVGDETFGGQVKVSVPLN